MTGVQQPAPPRPAGRPLPLAGGATPPPFLLPGEHFAAAFVWLAVGAAAMVPLAPQLAIGNMLDPRVIALSHMFALGVVTTSIFGALYQLFPVMVGIRARSLRVAHAGFWVLQAGIATIVAGFWTWNAALQAAGFGALLAAVVMVAWNLLFRTPGRADGILVARYVTAAFAALVLAIVIAAGRIGSTLGLWEFDRMGAIAAHFHLAAFGFATLTAAGVGSKMLPMFLLSHGHRDWQLRWLLPLAGTGLVLFAAGAVNGTAALRLAGAGMLAAAAILYIGLARAYFRWRVRRRLDAGLAHVLSAFASLGLALLLGLVLAVWTSGPTPRLRVSYAMLTLVGWLVLLIVGITYRILPFLTWLHRFSDKVGDLAMPSVADLTRRRWAWASLALLVPGHLTVAAAAAAGSVPMARVGATLFAAGVAAVLVHHSRLLTVGRGDGTAG